MKRVVVTNSDALSLVWGKLRGDIMLMYRLPFGVREFVSGRCSSFECDRNDYDLLYFEADKARCLVEQEAGERAAAIPMPFAMKPVEKAVAEPPSERQLACERIASLLRNIKMAESEDVLRHTSGKYYAVALHDTTPVAEKRGAHRASGMIRVYSAEYVAIRYRHEDGDVAKTFASVDNALMYLVAMFHLGDRAKADAVPTKATK
jgi:hypothetical protein